jgi:para-nitrobenzyl esterase
VAQLREIPTDRIMSAYGAVAQNRYARMTRGELGFMFAPVVDGTVLPQEPQVAIQQGASAEVAIMIGTDRDEMEIMRVQDPSFYTFDAQEVRRLAAGLFEDRVDEALAIYSKSAKQDPGSVWTAVDTDRTFVIPAIQLADARDQANGPTWFYLFSWTTAAFGGGLGAVHTLEIPFVFNTLERGASPQFTGCPPEAARPLAYQMHATWAAFAHNADPNNVTIPIWPAYDSTHRATMVFDTICVVRDDPHHEHRILWDGLRASS